MNTPEVLGFHHAQITVPPGKETEAREFYCGVLGLEEIPKAESLQGRSGFWMQLPGGFQVHVGIEEGFDRTRTKAHLAYRVRDLAGLRSRLVERGLQPLDSIPIPGYDRFECRDPFGNRMEFLE